MASMSYCRFENTLIDLAACVDAMEEVNEGDKENLFLGQYEVPNFHRMVEYCRQYIELYQELIDKDLIVEEKPSRY